MSAVELIRHSYAPWGTYGTLRCGDTILHTVEQPWNANKSGASCIPEGTYRLLPHTSSRYPNVWALVNHDLNIYYQPGPTTPKTGRYGILIHVANAPKDVRGCIGVGMAGHAMINGSWGITSSKQAIAFLRDFIPDNNITSITITAFRATSTNTALAYR